MTENAERDELADIVYKARWVDGIKDINMMTDSAIADAILAAGYTKPQQVTTVRDLHALPTDAVIRTAFGAVFVKDGGWWAETGARDKSLSVDLDLPATVLYSPAAHDA